MAKILKPASAVLPGKLVVLKPVVWNENGYTAPTGDTRSGGYADEHGYGHEEWNGRSDWIWNGWKVFHTQAKGRMLDYSAEGRLGIIMTTMRDKQFYAVGVGCNVYLNSPTEMADIAEELQLKRNGKALWKLEGISSRKNNDHTAFKLHWEEAHKWVNWRCPQTHYAWFEEPVRIVPNELIPSKPERQAIAKMHSSYQAIRPDQALAIVAPVLPPGHSILGWLSTSDFDPVPNAGVRNAASPKTKPGNSASTATDPHVRYLQECELVVTPRHHNLQSAFEAYLKNAGATGIKANIDRVDVRYKDPSLGPVLAEIKPSDPSTARFAIRAGMGQLLDYDQRASGNPRLVVVIDSEPSPEDLKLALGNGFGLAWRNANGFDVRWPKS